MDAVLDTAKCFSSRSYEVPLEAASVVESFFLSYLESGGCWRSRQLVAEEGGAFSGASFFWKAFPDSLLQRAHMLSNSLS